MEFIEKINQLKERCSAMKDSLQTEEATKAFNKALNLANTKNERALAYYNLAVISMNNKKYKEAIKYAEISKSIQPSEEINELVTAIRQYLGLRTKFPVANYLEN